eukprot:680045-Pelagomonas_calceolata.AAC.3
MGCQDTVMAASLSQPDKAKDNRSRAKPQRKAEQKVKKKNPIKRIPLKSRPHLTHTRFYDDAAIIKI